MKLFEQALPEWRRRPRKRALDPLAHFKSPAPLKKQPTDLAVQQPMACLVTDPILDLARAEEVFHRHQVSEGIDILQGGGGINTAADQQNVDAARAASGAGHPVGGPHEMQQPNLQQPSPAPLREPHNNPMSTVPGLGAMFPRFPGV